jgi:hypothetical protein
MSKKQTKKKGGDFLFIKLHKAMTDVVEEFCKESGFSMMDVGHNIGFISGSSPEAVPALISLNQTFFFAGMMYAKKYSGKYQYSYKKDKPLSEFEKIQKEINKKRSPIDYLG